MEIERILEILRLEDSDIRLYFTEKMGIRYRSYSPSISEELQDNLKKLVSTYLLKFSDMEQVTFSPIGYRDDTIETCNTEYIGDYDKVINSYNEANLNREDIDNNTINKLNFYCLVIKFVENNKEKVIRFFRKVTKFKKLSTSGFMGFIKNNRFNTLDSNLLGLDGFVDIVVYEGNVLILNHNALERVFSIADQYLEKAQNTIDIIRDINRIDNFEQFEEDCLNDRRITRTLTKMLSEETQLENCFDNFANVVNAIDLFQLDINIDRNGERDKVIYENKEQLMDIIRLVRDSYYKSIIHDRKGIDDSI
ncbi:Kiwa anti-phage protein KwaB-like domain-containing protein [Clostridioides difficile]